MTLGPNIELTFMQLKEIIQSNKQLTEIVSKADLLRKIEVDIQQTLAQMMATTISEQSFIKELLTKIHVSNYENGRLLLLCDDATINVRLRYLLPDLIQALRKENRLSNLVKIDIKTARTMPSIPDASPQKMQITPKSSKLLRGILTKLRNST